MRTLLIAIFLILSMQSVTAQEDSLANADIDTTSFVYGNVMYEKGAYDVAKSVYYNLLEKEGPSAILYYNIGNCHYRLQEVGACILAYERALQLDPGNDDVRYNLELANRLTRDKVEAAPATLFSVWWKSYYTSVSLNTWAWVAIFFMWVALVGWIIFLLPQYRQYQRAGFFSAVIAAVISIFCIMGYFGRSSYERSNTFAIVMTPSSIIKSEPSENSTNLALLHEGFKLKMLSGDSAWTEVLMPDGVVGWIRNTDIEAVDPFISE